MSDDQTMSEMPPPRATRASRSQPPLAPRPNPKAGPPTAAAATTATTAATTAPTQEAPPPEQQKKAASDILQRLRTLQELRPDELDHDELLDTVDELLVQCRGDKGQSKARTPDPDEDLLLELALQVKMSEKTVTAKLEAMEQMLLRQAVATEQWRASVTSELLKLNDTLNSTVHDIRTSLNALAWEKVDATVQPNLSQPSVSAGMADSRTGTNGAAAVTGKQVGAGTSVGGAVVNQVANFGGLLNPIHDLTMSIATLTGAIVSPSAELSASTAAWAHTPAGEAAIAAQNKSVSSHVGAKVTVSVRG